MSKRTLPLFPLKLVAFPGQMINLHVFEERYKDLANDCINFDSAFGIPVYNEGLQEYGSLMKINEVFTKYDDGRMDIQCLCTDVFRLMEFMNPMEGKIYAGGYVNIIQQIDNGDSTLQERLLELASEFFQHIDVELKAPLAFDISTFDLSQQLGLSVEDAYGLLTFDSEFARQEYLITHLSRIIPVLIEASEAKERIHLNGHFRHYDPLDL